jgi:hypothetical protein
MAHFNVITIEPVKTYATAENATKAVKKYADRFTCTDRIFNVIMMTTPEGRFYPLLCNIHRDYFAQVIHSGFSVVN